MLNWGRYSELQTSVNTHMMMTPAIGSWVYCKEHEYLFEVRVIAQIYFIDDVELILLRDVDQYMVLHLRYINCVYYNRRWFLKNNNVDMINQWGSGLLMVIGWIISELGLLNISEICLIISEYDWSSLTKGKLIID